jgi:uncharacterized damage-inducible protein DinB
MKQELIETWKINSRINLYLLNEITEDHLHDKVMDKGRNVGEQFGHIHNVRLMWLKEAMPLLLNTLKKIENDDTLVKAQLKKNLLDSSEAIEELLFTGLETGRIRGFKPHPAAFLGYLIAHESHHRGQIVLTLKKCEHPVSKKVLFGLWEWGVR